MSSEFDIDSGPDRVRISVPEGRKAWQLNITLPAETYDRSEVKFLIEGMADYLSAPHGVFEIGLNGIPSREGYGEVATSAANPSASDPDGVAISADALRYATVSEWAPHCFAQAEISFHNLTVVRRVGDETELLIRVAGGAGAHFTLRPDERNALVAALLRPA